MATGQVRIGVSGWRYVPWRGHFYPEGLRQADELAHLSRQLASVEINGSFYSLQRPSSWQAWHDATPDDFVFAVKAPRFITHVKRLVDIEAPFANFLASGVLLLGRKLGPLLWQFPPNFAFDPATFEPFLATLPTDQGRAAALARQHDERLRHAPALGEAAGSGATRAVRHAVEIRHPSFVDADFVRLLRRYEVALVTADTGRRFPEFEDLSADFVYLRLHGDEELYRSGYDAAALDRWASRIDAWRQGREPADARRIASAAAPKRAARDVYCYFDNTDKRHAPADAQSLRGRLGV